MRHQSYPKATKKKMHVFIRCFPINETKVAKEVKLPILKVQMIIKFVAQDYQNYDTFITLITKHHC